MRLLTDKAYEQIVDALLYGEGAPHKRIDAALTMLRELKSVEPKGWLSDDYCHVSWTKPVVTVGYTPLYAEEA